MKYFYLKKFFKNKKILITGHTGFKGSWLTYLLLKFGAHIIGLSLPPDYYPNLFQTLGLRKHIKNYFLDIRDFQGLKRVINKEKPEIIIHLAAQSIVKMGYDNPLDTFEINTLGTVNLLEAIRITNSPKALLVVTTDKVYENLENGKPFREEDKLGGHDPYSASKASAEIAIFSYIRSFYSGKEAKTFIATARSGNVLGGGDWQRYRLVPDIVRAVFENKKLIIRYPNAVRPWQFVLEPLFGYLLLIKKLYQEGRKYIGAWNFGPSSKNYCAVEEIVRRSFKILQKDEVLNIFLENNPIKEVQVLKLNSSKAKKYLRWEAKMGINEILWLTMEWYRNYYQNRKSIIDFTDKQIEYFLKRNNIK